MAIEALTMGTLKSRIHQSLANTGTVDANLASDLGWHINAVIRDIVQKTEHPAFRVEATASFVSGTNVKALADDVSSVIEGTVRHSADDYLPLQWFDYEEMLRVNPRFLVTTNDGRPRHWTLRNRDATTGLLQMLVSPVPDANYDIKYYYHAYPTSVISAADGTEIDKRFPREFAHLILDGVLLKYAEYLTPTKLAYHQQAYAQGVREFLSRMNAVTGVVNQQRPYRTPAMGGANRTLDVRLTGTIHD